MRAFFVHQNFPGQYRHVAPALAARPGTQVIALGENAGDPLPGVQHLRYQPPTAAGEKTHRYLRRLEAALFRGQQVARAALALKERGFAPDIVCCHPGWGEGLFLRDVWPEAKLLYYYEYYYTSTGGDVGFDPPGPVAIDDAARVRTLNANHLLCLQASDWGHTATRWQASRFPDWARAKLSVVHEGIDTEAIRRLPDPSLTLPDGRTLRRGDEVVTFIGRGLEPYRGFHMFMRALPLILEQRPAAQVVVVGGDDPHYGSKPREGGTWREVMLAELGERLDLSRVHFIGKVPHAQLQAVLGLSAAHVYLTYPFVLSWSMLEAMANECVVIGSATPPVQEVIEDGKNGLLVDFFAPGQLAATVSKVLASPASYVPLRAAARRTVVERYDLRSRCLPELLGLIEDVAAGRRPRLGGSLERMATEPDGPPA
ncbi:glycosyltransferase family 4 protein [Paracraurococcus ruber]|uniref:Glycosyl transferase family 1 n=1 Tax=Paracraurococcus ruber TaxID=77675 RepID=A0ABS1D260_9PROT|nr:glycosyltransferase family 4 protein [Paracraurococcus ruber]MBK1660869.1 glycosyl transferase family 1 [Paracraurococcus ruber]TDG29891.1 glycosyltransferase [Paracraurococcus ruber]